MKRPFVGLCIMFLMFLIINYAAGDESDHLPLYEIQELLEEQIGSGSLLYATGTVTECITLSSGIRLFMDHLTVCDENSSEFSILSNIKLTFITEETSLRPGDYIQVRGIYTPFNPASNPGQFDEKEYYFNKNTVALLKKIEILQVEPGKVSLQRWLYEIRSRLRTSYETILDEQTSGTIAAITLGEKNGMDQEWKDTFQEGGIAHILAISGLHISLMGMGFYGFLRRIQMSYGSAAICSGILVVAYAWMAGFGISAQRAVWMFFLWLGAQVCGRKYDNITAIVIAAVVIVGVSPGAIKEVSFLLSFSAVLVLAILVPCVQKTCRIFHPMWKTVSSGMLVWVGILPVTLWFFFQSAPWSILVNFVVIPLMSIVMVSGLAAAAVGLFSPVCGTFLAAPVYYFLYLFQWLCQLEQKLPLGVWVTGRPAVRRVISFYSLLVLAMILSWLCIKKEAVQKGVKKRKVMQAEAAKTKVPGNYLRGLWVVSICACVLLMCPPAPEKLTVTCLDVGQGDGALIRIPDGTCCLVDGGSTSERSIWEYRMEQAVKYYGVDTLDYIFISHADQDHINGITEFLQSYEPGFAGRNAHGISLRNLVLPPAADEEDFAELKLLAQEKRIQVVTMKKGAVIGIEMADKEFCLDQVWKNKSMEWSIKCLSPAADELTGDKNEDSMVLMLQYGSFRMLFTGDLEGSAERVLAVSDADLQADVLKVGHHGSANGSCTSFLREVQPQIAVISCGKDNSYGHPAPETMERLEQTGCEILQTQLCGAITILSDGAGFSVKTVLSDGEK